MDLSSRILYRNFDFFTCTVRRSALDNHLLLEIDVLGLPRVGNLLFGFLCESLVFWERKSHFSLLKEQIALFALFKRATRAIHSLASRSLAILKRATGSGAIPLYLKSNKSKFPTLCLPHIFIFKSNQRLWHKIFLNIWKHLYTSNFFSKRKYFSK